jgi:hypothetical protein
LPIVPAADGGLPVVGSAVIGKEILSATEHERYGVRPERKVSIAIISGGKTATGPIGCIVTDQSVISTIRPNKFRTLRKEINRIMRSTFMAASG